LKCPHCLTSYHPQISFHPLGEDKDHLWSVIWQKCSNCEKFIIHLAHLYPNGNIETKFLIYPKIGSRTPLSSDVPEEFAKDYKEACLVISDSPKASAALSRRCLQNILREKAKVRVQDLSKEIDEVLSTKKLPSYLAEGLDAIRNVGNFAAHPIKSSSSGEIVDVEPGEAEWLLDILEGLFDFFFVQPAELQRKKDGDCKTFDTNYIGVNEHKIVSSDC